MSDPKAEPCLVEDLDGFIKLYSDGSVVRSGEPFSLFPPLNENYEQVSFRDIVFDAENGLWARLYLPPQAQSERVPVVVYFHGGGFCHFSPRSPTIHRLGLVWASKLGAIIVSVGYRLAPEHRLPTAYEDSIAALHWLRSQSRGKGETEVDPWLDSHADFSRVFLAGESAGGNIAHHVGTVAVAKEFESERESFRVRGMILLYPHFGGEERTASETSGGQLKFNLEQSDALWRLALPPGSDRDHPFCNPLSPRSHDVGSLVFFPMLFVVPGRDILRDRVLQYCEVLKKCDKEDKIEVLVFEEEDHAFNVFEIESPNSLKVLRHISDFLNKK
uniref:Alpha/beta hydrolase fold-3 domain-containing protein n=1 Tax=Araucaria cunninghamii TaxID=56994 RepID=A0A0D6QVT5_ARACU